MTAKSDFIMKKINLQVKVSYTVDFDCEVTDDILEALECMQDEYPNGMYDDDTLVAKEQASKAFEWLTDKCNEDDAYGWSIEIVDMEENNEETV